jgi:hypothetical protein
MSDAASANFWIELREPKCVPDRKGPYPRRMMTGVIRECMKYRPTAYITVITWHDTYGPLLTDGPEWLMMRDGRSRPTALAHIRHTEAAHRDSSSDPKGEDAPAAECGASQSGGSVASASPNLSPNPSPSSSPGEEE